LRSRNKKKRKKQRSNGKRVFFRTFILVKVTHQLSIIKVTMRTTLKALEVVPSTDQGVEASQYRKISLP
jgi:hypothetical protein